MKSRCRTGPGISHRYRHSRRFSVVRAEIHCHDVHSPAMLRGPAAAPLAPGSAGGKLPPAYGGKLRNLPPARRGHLRPPSPLRPPPVPPGGQSFVLAAVPGEPRFVVLGLAEGASFATQESGPKSAAAARDALLSFWRQRACPTARLLEALDMAPPLVKSDNTAPAVKVAQELGARSASRCAVHIIMIPVRRVCFVRAADPRARPPREVGDSDVAPVLLKALELLRAWAVCLQEQVTSKKWAKHAEGASGPTNHQPRPHHFSTRMTG